MTFSTSNHPETINIYFFTHDLTQFRVVPPSKFTVACSDAIGELVKRSSISGRLFDVKNKKISSKDISLNLKVHCIIDGRPARSVRIRNKPSFINDISVVQVWFC